MKSVSGVLVAALVGSLFWALPVQAQQGRIAQGSYLETCRNAGMKGTTLEADCRDRNGEYRHSVLPNAFACEMRIANFDGRLVCQGAGGAPGYGNRGPGDRGPSDRGYGDRGYGGPGYGGPGDRDRGPEHGGQAGGPAGSYQRTCRNVVVRGESLAAFCRARDGRDRETVLDNFRRCRGDIANNDGRLFCIQ